VVLAIRLINLLLISLTLAIAKAWSRKYALWHITNNKGNDMANGYMVELVGENNV
jgi:hypothetical protein